MVTTLPLSEDANVTAQIPESLENEHPRLVLGPLALYAVVTGDPRHGDDSVAPYEHAVRADPPAGTFNTASSKRYIGCYRIDVDGHVVLDAYAYPFTSANRTLVGETLRGDFFLVMKETFYAGRVYVPFRAGIVVESPRDWLVERRRVPVPSPALRTLLGR